MVLQGTTEPAILKAMTGKSLMKLCKNKAQSLVGHWFAITVEEDHTPSPKAVQQLLHS